MGSTGEQVIIYNRDIRENTLFTIAKKEIAMGFLLLSI